MLSQPCRLTAALASAFWLDSDGKNATSNAARKAMIATTTRSSTRVKPIRRRLSFGDIQSVPPQIEAVDVVLGIRSHGVRIHAGRGHLVGRQRQAKLRIGPGGL